MKNSKLKLAIIGHGFVGKAMDEGFTKNVDKLIIDPKYGNSLNDIEGFEPHLCFVCVPTPMANDGTQDSSIIEETIIGLKALCPGAIVCVKSTVLPSILVKLTTVNQNLIYNPEFLREKYANEDFINSKLIIFGGDSATSKKVSKFYKDHSQCSCKNHIFLDTETASLAKYTINTYLATKVIFLNEIYEIFKEHETDDKWLDFTNALVKDERFGQSHNDVPGPDGRFGFGGACFPKDSLALIRYAKEKDIDLNVLKAVVKKNNKIRSQYKDLDSREIEQNISYDDKI
jgi:UDPglucose 6-dehydrogenase